MTAREYQYLLQLAATCRSTARQLDHPRAQQLLTTMARHCDALTAVFDRRPELHEYLQHLPYRRAVDLLSELIRQVHAQARTIASYETTGTAYPRRTHSEVWDEIDAMAGRTDELARLVVEHAPDLRLGTPAGARALSAQLISTAGLDEAADTITTAIVAARRLPHPDPAIGELEATAADLRRRAQDLRRQAQCAPDWWTIYFTGRSRPHGTPSPDAH